MWLMLITGISGNEEPYSRRTKEQVAHSRTTLEQWKIKSQPKQIKSLKENPLFCNKSITWWLYVHLVKYNWYSQQKIQIIHVSMKKSNSALKNPKNKVALNDAIPFSYYYSQTWGYFFLKSKNSIFFAFVLSSWAFLPPKRDCIIHHLKQLYFLDFLKQSWIFS